LREGRNRSFGDRIIIGITAPPARCQRFRIPRGRSLKEPRAHVNGIACDILDLIRRRIELRANIFEIGGNRRSARAARKCRNRRAVERIGCTRVLRTVAGRTKMREDVSADSDRKDQEQGHDDDNFHQRGALLPVVPFIMEEYSLQKE
jgi:hypothetical protein